MTTLTGPSSISAGTNVYTAATGQVTITGAAQLGQTLTADTSDIGDVDGLIRVSYSYQWIRVDGINENDISGETSSSYVLVDADVGKTIQVGVSFTDGDGNTETLTSAPTGTVVAPEVRIAAGSAVNDQVSAWAALGYGAGDLTFQPEDGDPVRTALSLALGAVGLRGEVLRPLEAGGLSLAVKGDVRVTRTSSKAAGDTMVGRLMAAEADVWRVRAGVEGARNFMANDDAWATVTPSFEVGVRLDGGDAETGFGADVGGGVALVDPGRGVTLEMKARALAAHEAEGLREWGASAALAWEPRPQSGRGLSLLLTQSWGASSSGGMDALLSRDTLVGLAASDTAPAGRRLEAELGYGMTVFGGDFTATPNAGLTLTEDGRDWRLGWRLAPAWPDGSGFEVNLDATRSETGDETPAHAVILRGALRF